MGYFYKSFEEAKWFASTAEELLEGVKKPGRLFGMAHVFDGESINRIRSSQKEAISEAVGQIAETFDPNNVGIDEERLGYERPGTIAVYAANVKRHENNPLYDQGLPNVFIRPVKDNLSTVTLQYIEDHGDRGIGVGPDMHPAVSFDELPGGKYELDLSPWVPEGFEVPIRHAERLSRTLQLIGSKICAPELRPQLVVIKYT